MSLDPKDHAAVQTRLWDEIEHGDHTGMLGLMASGQHFQPMTAFVDRTDNTLWFFARTDSDLAGAIAADAGGQAMFVFQAKRLQACIGGRLSLSHDRERMDRYWNPVVAAWYPDGKDDPHLTLIRLDAEDAQVWITEAGPVRFAFEIAKANLGKDLPDLGDQTHLNLH